MRQIRICKANANDSQICLLKRGTLFLRRVGKISPAKAGMLPCDAGKAIVRGGKEDAR
jgi:hypothetical protein